MKEFYIEIFTKEQKLELQERAKNKNMFSMMDIEHGYIPCIAYHEKCNENYLHACSYEKGLKKFEDKQIVLITLEEFIDL